MDNASGRRADGGGYGANREGRGATHGIRAANLEIRVANLDGETAAVAGRAGELEPRAARPAEDRVGDDVIGANPAADGATREGRAAGYPFFA
jgi:hypothetical protein